MMIRRNYAILLFIIIISFLLLSCQKDEPSNTLKIHDDSNSTHTGEEILAIYNWSDYIAPDTITRFEQESGIKVIYDVYDTNAVLDEMLRNENSKYDVVFPSARPYAAHQITAELFQPIDHKKLTHYQNLDLEILQALTDIDPDNAYLVPYMWGTTGIGINITRVQHHLGTTQNLDTWALIYDPQINQQLQGCGISLLDEQQEGIAAATFYSGKTLKQVDNALLKNIIHLYQQTYSTIRYFDSNQYIDDLVNNKICVAMGYSGDIIQARQRAKKLKNGPDIRYIIPQEGALRWIDVMAIPKHAKHVKNAHLFINFILRPEIIASISNYVSYANANRNASPLLDKEIRNNPSIYPSQQTLSTLADQPILPESEIQQRVEIWEKIKQGSE